MGKYNEATRKYTLLAWQYKTYSLWTAKAYTRSSDKCFAAGILQRHTVTDSLRNIEYWQSCVSEMMTCDINDFVYFYFVIFIFFWYNNSRDRTCFECHLTFAVNQYRSVMTLNDLMQRNCLIIVRVYETWNSVKQFRRSLSRSIASSLTNLVDQPTLIIIRRYEKL